MQKLSPKGAEGMPFPAPLSRKERLIKDIREFVGPGGYVPFEHGFRPSINAQAVDEDGIVLVRRLGRERRRRIEFSEIDETTLTNVILNLFRYSNYCHLYA